MSIGEKIRKYRKQNNLTQLELAQLSNLSRTYVADVERGRYNPSVETLKTIAAALKIDPAQLISEEKPYYALTEKDEKDIAKKLEAMLEELDSDSALSFLGEPMGEEDRELLRISLENALRMSREMAKKKFTPNKYRK